MSPRQTYEIPKDGLGAVVAWHAAYDHQEAMLQRFGIAYVFHHPELLMGRLPIPSHWRVAGDSLGLVSDSDYMLPPAQFSRAERWYAARTDLREGGVPNTLEASIHTAARFIGYTSATRCSPYGCTASYSGGNAL